MLLYNSIWGVGSLSQGFQAKKSGIRQVGFVPPPPTPSIGVGMWQGKWRMLRWRWGRTRGPDASCCLHWMQRRWKPLTWQRKRGAVGRTSHWSWRPAAGRDVTFWIHKKPAPNGSLQASKTLATAKHHATEGRRAPAACSWPCLTSLSESTRN